MPEHIKNFLVSAESKALATFSAKNGINVVPVSTIKVIDNTIVLINYFMDKTLANIIENKNVALVVWSKMKGYQIKGSAEYKVTGEIFDSVVRWVAETIPNRVVKGIIILSPLEIFDVAPDKTTDQYLRQGNKS
jgi:predicted pyridoxine 5'-phosphate oxidase superfamily flavin-nucleotide-binding protein